MPLYGSRLLNRLIGRATDPAWADLDEVADGFAIPRTWIICPHCGQQNWRIPPHGLDPCPFVVSIAESTGLKFDAERSTAVRAGIQMEEVTRALRQMLGDGDEDE